MAAAMVAIMAVGCDTQATDQASEGTDARADWPDKLVITLIPSEDQATVTRRYEPLAEYLGKQLDLEVEIFFPQSYTASIEAMRSDRVDIGFFGPFAYILAAERADAIAFPSTILPLSLWKNQASGNCPISKVDGLHLPTRRPLPVIFSPVR